MGENHNVDIYLSDTIFEFKEKMTAACLDESRKWATNVGQDSPEATMYKDILIGTEHLVMVFVPPAKLIRLAQAGNMGGNEYGFAYSMAIEDPSNWEPLDPRKTFEQYNHRFGFVRAQPGPPQLVRVVEATAKYKEKNLRYREFDKARNQKSIIDTNEEEECFGWAKYQFTEDRPDSYEWRPAIIKKPVKGSSPETQVEKYRVTWLVKPPSKSAAKPLTNTVSATSSKEAPEAATVELDRQCVLMAPKMPKLDHYVHPQHTAVLKQARTLRQIGKSDYEIEAMLNKILNEQNKGDAGKSKVPKITVEIIKKFMSQKAES